LALLTVPSGWMTPEDVDAAGERSLVLQLFFVAVLDARQVGADDLVDLLLGQRAVGVARAAAHADPDLVFAALGELGAAPLAAAAASARCPGCPAP
jgi:hypothetical protein